MTIILKNRNTKRMTDIMNAVSIEQGKETIGEKEIEMWEIRLRDGTVRTMNARIYQIAYVGTAE